MKVSRGLCAIFASIALWAQPAQSPAPAGDVKQRVRSARDLAKSGTDAIGRLAPYLSDPEAEVRAEAVKSLTEIGSLASIDPLTAATRDNDPEVQIRAVDGLVNFYVPGYVRSAGLSASIKRVGSAIKSKFTDNPDVIVDPYVQPRPEIISALGRLIRGGSSMESRANAARAAGVLKGRAVQDDLVQALRSKDDQLIYESLIALQKIRDSAVAPRLAFLFRDLNDRVQLAAIETAGLLRSKQSSPDLRDVVEHPRTDKARRAALSALAMLSDESNRALFSKYFADKDDALRAAAAEGLGRLKNPSDLQMFQSAFEAEKKMNPRLSQAFACVLAGRNELSEFSPLQYLVNTLNSKAYKGVAQPFLVEIARDPGVRRTLYGALRSATKDEKIFLGQVLAASGDAESVKYLETLAADPDADVAAEGLRALKTLKTRL